MVSTASGTTEAEVAAAILTAAESRPDGWLSAEQEETLPRGDRSAAARLWEERLRQLTSKSPMLKIVVAGGELYPRNLAAAPGRPALLFIDGHLTDDDTRAVAVVGSRAGNGVALEMTRSVAAGLAARGITVVSGLARGVDTSAHEGALAGGGRTIAVMGTGVGTVFPPENVPLSERIRAKGALVSQFPPGYGPTKTTFPVRNAVIAGLSLASVVMTAKERSGTRIEIDYTLALGRPVLLWRALLEEERWAQDLVGHPLVRFVGSTEEIAETLSSSALP